MGKSKRLISLELSDDLIEAAKMAANTKEISMSAFVRLAIINYLDQERNKIERKENI